MKLATEKNFKIIYFIRIVGQNQWNHKFNITMIFTDADYIFNLKLV